MNYLDVCAGIGGFALGLEMAGLRFGWHGYSEIDRHCEENYARHYPAAVRLGDLARWREWRLPPINIFCAGFPCPPFSVAGRRLGGDDSHNLWPLVAGAIRGLRPHYVLLENVGGLLYGKPGRPAYFGRVLGDLAEAGYDAEWEVLLAQEVGASHRRERVFVVAHDNRCRSAAEEREYQALGREQQSDRLRGVLAHADGAGRGEQRGAVAGGAEQPAAEHGGGAVGDACKRGRARESWGRTGALAADRYMELGAFPPGPADAGGWRAVLARWPDLAPAVGGKLNVRFVTWLMGFPIGWCNGMKRAAALRALGNAVVPQCVAEAVRRLLRAEGGEEVRKEA